MFHPWGHGIEMEHQDMREDNELEKDSPMCLQNTVRHEKEAAHDFLYVSGNQFFPPSFC